MENNANQISLFIIRPPKNGKVISLGSGATFTVPLQLLVMSSLVLHRVVSNAGLVSTELGVVPGIFVLDNTPHQPVSVFDKLFKHPFTDRGIDSFLADWEKVKNR